MREPESPRTNVLVLASLTLSAISLFVAISGAATAGKNTLPANSVGSKQLKNDAVRPADIAPDAVTTEALATDSVTGDAIGSDVVTGSEIRDSTVDSRDIETDGILAQDIASLDGDVIEAGTVAGQALGNLSVQRSAIALGAVDSEQMANGAVGMDQISYVAEAKVSAANVGGFTPIPSSTCNINQAVAFTTVDYNVFGVFDNTEPDRLTATVPGRYTVTVNGSWASGGGNKRILQVIRTIGSGPNEGNKISYVTSGAPSGVGATDQNGTWELELLAGDEISLAAGACGDVVNLQNVSLGMRWVGPEGP